MIAAENKRKQQDRKSGIKKPNYESGSKQMKDKRKAWITDDMLWRK